LILTKLNWNLPSVVALDYLDHIIQVSLSQVNQDKENLRILEIFADFLKTGFAGSVPDRDQPS
jgi:hypothetical protein